MTTALPQFLIADFQTGLDRSKESWLIPRDAFPILLDSYLFRGVLRKKGGSVLLGADVDKSRVKDDGGTVLGGPILGLRQQELTSINSERLIAFGANSTITTAYANYFQNSTAEFLHSTATSVTTWSVDDKTFFWGRNYYASLWVTASNLSNPIRYTFDPTSATAPWHNFVPQLTSGGTTLDSTLMLIPYKNRLVCLHTKESGVLRPQRARWSQNGNPYVSTTAADIPPNITTPTVDTAWRHDIVGKGGYIDAPTDEQIISCEFQKDVLIVFFERSTWQLRYTGEQLLPFVWERVNSERGAESTFSSVRLPNGLACVGYNGVMISDGVNTERLDTKIPDLVYGFGNEEEIPKVHGVRDFWGQCAYWTYVDQSSLGNTTPRFPNRMLYYNYQENTWAIFKNTYTAFSHYTSFDDRTWAQYDREGIDTWENTAEKWNSSSGIKGFPQVVAGNQQGFVFVLHKTGPSVDSIADDRSLQCSVVTSPTVVCTNHNLATGDFVRVSDTGAGSDGQIFKVERIDKDSFTAIPKPATDTEETEPEIETFAEGYLSVVSNFLIQSKKLNPLVEGGDMGRLVYMDTFCSSFENSEFEASLFADNNTARPVSQQTINPVITSSGYTEDKVWKRVFIRSIADFFTVEFSFPEEKMYSNARTTDVRIHGLLFYMRDSGGRITK